MHRKEKPICDNNYMPNDSIGDLLNDDNLQEERKDQIQADIRRFYSSLQRLGSLDEDDNEHQRPRSTQSLNGQIMQ